jgi:hypothetical protein
MERLRNRWQYPLTRLWPTAETAVYQPHMRAYVPRLATLPHTGDACLGDTHVAGFGPQESPISSDLNGGSRWCPR